MHSVAPAQSFRNFRATSTRSPTKVRPLAAIVAVVMTLASTPITASAQDALNYTSVAMTGGAVTRINSGAASVESSGVTWRADEYFVGGQTYLHSRVTQIEGTDDDAVYLSGRSATTNLGGFAYSIPATTAGSYTVTLHFAEIYFGATGGGVGAAGKRVFSANIEGGVTELTDFDIFASVGAMTATSRSFEVPITDGTLDIAFSAKVDRPSVAAITVTAPGTTDILTEPSPTTVDLRVSSSVSQAPSAPLAGSILTQEAFIFVPTYPSISMVEFWLDDPGIIGPPRWVDSAEPFDFAGGLLATPIPFDSSTLTDGAHNISARMTSPEGATAMTTSSFTVSNSPSGVLAAPALSTPFSWDSKSSAPIGLSEAQGAAVGEKVYVFSGFDAGSTTTARSSVYDTTKNSWSALPDTPIEVTHAPAVVDGETIWLIGGYRGDHPGPAIRDVWKFDTVTRLWRVGPPLPAPRGAGAAAIVGRQLHYFGGTNRVAGSTADLDQSSHWVLNLDGGTTWSSRAALPNPRNHLTGIAVGGKIYAIGGQHNENENTGLQSDVHRYNPATNAWTKVASLPKARSHSAAVGRDGQIIVMGGTNPGAGASSDVTAYHPQQNVWSKLPSLPGGRKTAVAAVVNDVVYFTGGSHSTATYGGRFNGRWETAASMPTPLGEVASGLIGNTLYMVGEASTKTLALNVSTGVWRSDLPVRPYTGHHHAAEVIGGKLYLFGGLGAGAGRVQIYDPGTRSWSLGPSMPFAAGSSSTAVIGGKVYVAGGIVGSVTTDRVARFDPATKTWTALARMPQGRNHAASGTDGSKLFVFGGRGAGSGDGNTVANGFDTVQVYDPETDTWRSSVNALSGLTPLPQARGGMGKAVFSAGSFVVLGGETVTGVGATPSKVYSRVDIYTPASDTWQSGTPMLTARHGIYPVLVGNRVIVAGGGVKSGYSSSTRVEILTVPRS